MQTTVAMVRERHLSTSEMINYQFDGRYDVTEFGVFGRSYDTPHPVRKLPSSASVPTSYLGDAARAAMSLFFGSSTYMYGLVDELSSYEIVHTVETFQGFSEQAIDAKVEHGCRVVCTVFENIPYFAESPHYSQTWREYLKHREATRIKERVRRNADAFVAVTNRAATALEIEGVDPEKIHTVPIGIDVDRFRPGAASLAQNSLPGFLGDDSRLNVVFVGRYTWEKGVFDLLSAWKRVSHRSCRELGLTLIGAGPDEERIRRFVTRADVPNVAICGRVPYDRIPAVYNAADLTVVPSLPTRFWQEQFGRVVVESQACETPVLASESGGIPDAMGGAGVLVQSGDPHDWSEKILSLVRDEDRRERLGKEGREHAVAERSIEQVAERIADIYGSIL